MLTEPVPDVLEAIGWTGGECITDARTFVHYFRTTRDGRIAFGWGGGRLAPGARLGGRVEVDAEVAAETRRHLVAMFPQLEGRAITHAWGGPIDVSPSHLPQIGTLDGAPVHYAFGYTGNGVGPSHLAGRILADAGDGGERARCTSTTSRSGCRRSRWPGRAECWCAVPFYVRNDLKKRVGAVDPVTRAVAAAPRALGIHVAR